MRVLQVCAEIFPLLKTGGLADVAGALPPALAALGDEVRVLLPGFDAILDGLQEAVVVAELQPPPALHWGSGGTRLLWGRLPAVGEGVTAYVIDAPGYYRRPGGPYADANRHPYGDNHLRFALKGIAPEEMEEQVEDIAGIRIICQFVEDIEKVADLIQKRSDIEIKSEKDYIRHMKDSGYRSYHLIVYYTVETMNGPKRIQVEIQIRTMAMDFWATIEHSLQYKYKANIPDHIRERLSAAAKAIIVLDNEMSSVRSEIMDAQNSSQIQRNLITDILNNIENLYKVTNKREVEKIQDEFYHIYAQNDLQELKRFHKELDLIAEGYRAQAITDEL